MTNIDHVFSLCSHDNKINKCKPNVSTFVDNFINFLEILLRI